MSGGYDGERAAVIALFETAWPIGNPLSPVPFVQMPNVAFTPNDGDRWARLTILSGNADQKSLAQIGSGLRIDRAVEQVVLQCFQPVGTGTGDCDKMVDFAATIFKGQQLTVSDGGIIFLTPRRVYVGRQLDNWDQTNMVCPFWRDQRS